MRSQPTRDRIVAAARRQFAEEGFERATIRSIAAEAGIHPSMVMRYHSSKEGLFAATVDFDLQLPDLAAVPRESVGTTLAAHLLARWEDPEATDLPALLRLAATHEGARDRLLEVLQQQVSPALARVCRPDRVADCAVLVGTQAIGLAYARFVLKLAPVVAMPRDLLVARIGAVLQGHVDEAS